MKNSIGRKTIYLDDALEAIRKLPNVGVPWLVSAESAFNALLKLPSTQPEPQWIPVTKRMPNENYRAGKGIQLSKPVLVTVVDDGDTFVDMYSTINGTWPLWGKVTAWMPLPAPYRKEDANE